MYDRADLMFMFNSNLGGGGGGGGEEVILPHPPFGFPLITQKR